MRTKIGGLAFLCLLSCMLTASANPPPQFVVSLTEKGHAIGGVNSQTASSLSVSVRARQFDAADSVTVVFMWPEGAQDADGNYRTLQRIACRKVQTADGTILWTADVERMRDCIVDTGQCLSFYFEAEGVSNRFLRLSANTFSSGRGVAHVDDALGLRIDCPDERDDHTRALQILPRERASKKK